MNLADFQRESFIAERRLDILGDRIDRRIEELAKNGEELKKLIDSYKLTNSL